MKFRPSAFTYRGDPNPGSPVEWEDNALSNTMAWASHKLTPAWCQSPGHWSSRLSAYLWSDCPCCLFFRGVVLGLGLGFLSAWLLALGLALAISEP